MNIDKSNMLKDLDEFPEQCAAAWELGKDISLRQINRILICGMGGSAIGGDYLQALVKTVPVEVLRGYTLPDYVDEDTLVFVVSYSGNTEETLSCFEQAVYKKAEIVCVSSGGKLSKLADKLIRLPAGLQPRCATGYLFFPTLRVLHENGIIDAKKDVKETVKLLKKVDKKYAQKLAKNLFKKTPLIYSSRELFPVAYRWRTQINENAKQMAFSHVFPEMCHNEIMGYHSAGKQFEVVLLKDGRDHKRVHKRMAICKKIFKKQVKVNEYEIQGKSRLARMLSTIYLGDYVSYYLALLNKVDPSPVKIIEWMKKELNK